MGKFLVLILSTFGASAIKQLLTGAGLGLASSVVVKTILNMYIDRALNGLGGVQVSGLLAIGGLDVAISVIIGALIMRATILSFNVQLVKA